MSNINAITESNINDMFDSFYSLLTSTINAHAPLKKLTRKQKRLKNKPCITKGLLISIKRKQKMHKTHYINGSSVAKQCYNYKMYCNVSRKIKNLAKKMYYRNKLKKYFDNPKNTWDVLRTLLPNKSSFNNPTSTTFNNTTITDPKAIAEEFNNHFANIGEHLANSVNKVNHDNFCAYLKNACPSSIYLQPSTPQEICMLINSLKQNKASGHDDIFPYFLKITAPIIALPLSTVFNYCLTFGVFPGKLKLAKVIPVYKKGSFDQLTNYRPISLLSSFF